MKYKYIIIILGFTFLIAGILSYMNNTQVVINLLDKIEGKGIISSAEEAQNQSGIILSSNVFRGWTYYITGNESVLYDIKSLTKEQICIIPKDIEMKDIIEKGVVYKYPKDIKMYDISKGINTELNTKDLTKDKQADGSVCFDLNNSKSMFYKLGENSIVISGLSNYVSTNTNVTQENLFTHLNLTDGSLVLYMPFDVIQDSANKTYDYSNYSNDGTLVGGTSVIHPIFNSTGGFNGSGAYKFDGSNDYINLSSYSEKDNQSITYAAWFKTNGFTPAGHQSIIDGENVQGFPNVEGCGIRRNSNGYLYAYCANFAGDSMVIYTPLATDTTWHFVALTYNYASSNLSLYLDGRTFASTATTSMVGYNAQDSLGWIDIGREYYNIYYFNGSIDEVMIFNRSLSSTEIGQIYNSTFSRFYPVGEMNFTNNNFGTNNTVNITIPNCQQYNGSLINFKVNGGSYSQLNSSCMFNGYNMTGNLTSASVVLQLNSSNLKFYSPLIVGNITLNDYYISSGDTTPPGYFTNSINNTVAGVLTNFAINVTDETALNPNGMYVFSTNNTGSVFVNDSTVLFTTTPSWANVTKTLNSTVGKVIGYRWYFNDSAGNTNSTPVYILTTTDNTPPTISFESPTPSNTSSTTSPVTIVANISDSSNTSSWIDFDRSLVGYWAMDYYNSTGVYDNSTYSNFGTFAAGTGLNYSNLTTGARGQGLKFDGSNDYLNVPTLGSTTTQTFNNSGKLTFSAWINPDVLAWKGIMGTDVVRLHINVDSVMITMYNITGICSYTTAGGIVTQSIWQHVSMSYDRATGNVSVYHNGIFIGSKICLNANLTSTSDSFHIGEDWADYFNGSIDEVLIFNRTLSSTEILALYNSTNNKFNTSAMILPNGQHNYTVYAIDKAGNINNSGWRNFIVDSTPPTYNLNSTNNTNAGQITNFAINVTDNTALHSNGGYIFSTNNTGSVFVNDSTVLFSTTPSWANVTKTLNSTVGKVIGYRWYFNDSAGNTNSTPVYVLTTSTSSSSCTYSSGNWNILFSDYCNITSPVDVGGNSITITGAGEFRTTANITGWRTLNLSGTGANSYNAYCLNGGCFR